MDSSDRNNAEWMTHYRVLSKLSEVLHRKSNTEFDAFFDEVIKSANPEALTPIMKAMLTGNHEDVYAVQFSERCLGVMLIKCPPLSKLVNWTEVGEKVCNDVFRGFIFPVYLIPSLGNIVDVNKIQTKQGETLLHAMLGDSTVENTLLFKSIEHGDLDVNALSTQHGRPIHCLDLDRERLQECVQHLINMGADPFESITFKRKQLGFDVDREYTSFEDFMEQNKNNHGPGFRNGGYIEIREFFDKFKSSLESIKIAESMGISSLFRAKSHI